MILYMAPPNVGDIEIKSIAGMPSVGVQITIDGVQYKNKKPFDVKLKLTIVTPGEKNWYVGGTFNGKLTSLDRSKSIIITNRLFDSAYL